MLWCLVLLELPAVLGEWMGFAGDVLHGPGDVVDISLQVGGGDFLPRVVACEASGDGIAGHAFD